MTGMDDLVTWLRAQLDEDERVATAAHANAWNAEASHHDGEFVIVPDYTPSGVGVVFGAKNAEHIARWDPARVLVEVDAKRRIIDAFERNERDGEHPDGKVFGYHATGLLLAVRYLALAYADRPGYQEEWRPA